MALDLVDEDLETMLKFREVRDADIELTDLGKRQAEETGRFLSGTDPFDICFTSPYVRTKMTTGLIVQNLGYYPRVFEDERLREKEFGRLHGMTTAEIREKYPEEFSDREREGKYLTFSSAVRVGNTA